MAIKCGNCGAYVRDDELAMRKPPRHPWRLTPAGEQALARNQQPGGDSRPCPECGNATLLGEARRPRTDVS